MSLKIDQNRKDRKYPLNEQLLRVLWIFGKIIFRLTPRPLFGLRCSILRLYGAKIGKHVNIYSSTQIYFPWKLTIGDWSAIGEQAFIYNLGSITIGEKSTISHKTHLCAGTHDYTNASLPLLKPTITVEDQVWIASEAFVGPGVSIGQGAVIGARAAVFKDVEPWSVVGGNPARLIKKRTIKE
nr:hypothetical protein [uncultured Sunxiuqinia sp.]